MIPNVKIVYKNPPKLNIDGVEYTVEASLAEHEVPATTETVIEYRVNGQLLAWQKCPPVSDGDTLTLTGDFRAY